MNCGQCDKRPTLGQDYLCESCREFEDLVQTGDYPESIKYHQIAKEEGPILTKFLDWLAAEGYDICGFNTYTEEYVPYVFGSGEALLREYAGVDSERLELERRAMIESLARANRK